MEQRKHKAFHAARLLFSILLFTNCSTAQKYKEEKDSAYEIINLHNFGDQTLFYRTLAFKSYMEKQCFHFECINRHTVKESMFFEKEGVVNFDSIFTKTEQKTIEDKLRTSESIELDASKLANPESLAREKSNRETPPKGFFDIMFPVIQKNEKGNYYAFFYKSWSANGSGEGTLYIYEKKKRWKYLCKVPIFIE